MSRKNLICSIFVAVKCNGDPLALFDWLENTGAGLRLSDTRDLFRQHPGDVDRFLELFDLTMVEVNLWLNRGYVMSEQLTLERLYDSHGGDEWLRKPKRPRR